MDETVTESASARLPSAGWRIGQIDLTSAAAQSIARTVRNAVLVALALVLAWLAINVLLMIFAGILLAIFLRGLADVVRHLSEKFGLRLPIGLALPIVILGILVIFSAMGWFFNNQIDSQIAQLSRDLPRAFHNFEDKVRQFYWGRLIFSEISPAKIATTNPGNIAGTVASTAFGVAQFTVEIIAGIVIFFFIGLYGAVEPDVYARGAVSLVAPAKRPRALQILQQTADTLWYWEMGRLFSMTVIGFVIGVGLWLLGVPVPGALGLLAGILTFIPYAGSVISAVPAVLLAFTIGSELALYTILLYVGAHVIEGYILVPLVQKRAAHLPPALTLSAQAILSVIVGIAGLALATPIIAAALVLTKMIYVEGVLDDATEAAADAKQS
jgi:predicted PurR-regulated permease PerM